VQRYTSLYTGVIGHYAKVTGTRFIWISTDNQVPYKNHFLKNQREVLKRVSRPLYKKIVLILNAFLRDLFRNFGMKYVTYPCIQNSIQSDLLFKNYGLKGIHFPSGHEIPLQIPEKSFPPIILWVANMGRKKRPELFVELSCVCQDLNAKFVMVGNHPDKEYIDALISPAIKNSNFEWKGSLPFEETLSLFDISTLFINTSESAGEGFPNTFIQSWLRGVPIISFEVDPDGVIARNELGEIVTSIREAKEAIIKYMTINNLSFIRETIQKFALRYYNICNVANQFWNILKESYVPQDKIVYKK
jgi:glycosyltransferase involved in cell wall biosynthesis